MDEFTKAYIECALWSSTDQTNEGGGEPLDENYDADDISAECLKQIVKDCTDFQRANAALLAEYCEHLSIRHAGHDFWLTRNHHGAGFWDRALGKLGAKLSDAAHVYGNCDPYVFTDGRIYCH